MKATKAASFLLSLILLGCAADGGGEAGDVEASFGAFAGALYTEMRNEPLGDSVDVELGLFGDLNVMPGERVVMGRYRYRVDSIDGVPVGFFSLLVRPAGEQIGVPVQVTFARRGRGWELREAEHVLTPNGAESEGHAPTFRLREALEGDLESWVHRASENASSMSP